MRDCSGSGSPGQGTSSSAWSRHASSSVWPNTRCLARAQDVACAQLAPVEPEQTVERGLEGEGAVSAAHAAGGRRGRGVGVHGAAGRAHVRDPVGAGKDPSGAADANRGVSPAYAPASSRQVASSAGTAPLQSARAGCGRRRSPAAPLLQVLAREATSRTGRPLGPGGERGDRLEERLELAAEPGGDGGATTRTSFRRSSSRVAMRRRTRNGACAGVWTTTRPPSMSGSAQCG